MADVTRLFEPGRIGALELENRVIMAPMAGISNLPFRLMVKKMGASGKCPRVQEFLFRIQKTENCKGGKNKI